VAWKRFETGADVLEGFETPPPFNPAAGYDHGNAAQNAVPHPSLSRSTQPYQTSHPPSSLSLVDTPYFSPSFDHGLSFSFSPSPPPPTLAVSSNPCLLGNDEGGHFCQRGGRNFISVRLHSTFGLKLPGQFLEARLRIVGFLFRIVWGNEEGWVGGLVNGQVLLHAWANPNYSTAKERQPAISDITSV
jgi:hypothetical protein